MTLVCNLVVDDGSNFREKNRKAQSATESVDKFGNMLERKGIDKGKGKVRLF